jgi:hypothetical protein
MTAFTNLIQFNFNLVIFNLQYQLTKICKEKKMRDLTAAHALYIYFLICFKYQPEDDP